MSQCGRIPGDPCSNFNCTTPAQVGDDQMSIQGAGSLVNGAGFLRLINEVPGGPGWVPGGVTTRARGFWDGGVEADHLGNSMVYGIYIYNYSILYWLVVSNIFIFHNIWDKPSRRLIFFKMVKTTNQYSILYSCWAL